MNIAYKLIQKHFPRQVATVADHGPGVLAVQLNSGRRMGHHANIKYLKKAIKKIYKLEDMPEDRTQWGFNNPQTAELLRPIHVELNSPEW